MRDLEAAKEAKKNMPYHGRTTCIIWNIVFFFFVCIEENICFGEMNIAQTVRFLLMKPAQLDSSPEFCTRAHIFLHLFQAFPAMCVCVFLEVSVRACM